MNFGTWRKLEGWRGQVWKALKKSGRDRQALRWARCGSTILGSSCAQGHEREAIAGFRCELRACPRCTAKHALRVAARADRAMLSLDGWARAIMLTFTRRPKSWPMPNVSAAEDAKAVSLGLAAVQKRLAGDPCVLGSIGTVEWGKKGGLAHAHVLVAVAPVKDLDTQALGNYLVLRGQDAWTSHTPWCDAKQFDAKAAEFKGVRWYLLEYALKSACCSPDAAANRILALRGLRRYRTSGCFYGLGDDPEDQEVIDPATGEVLDAREDCTRCDEVRLLTSRILAGRPLVLDNGTEPHYAWDVALGEGDGSGLFNGTETGAAGGPCSLHRQRCT